MAIPQKLERFLTDRKIPFRTETHPEAFTARQAAQAAHVPENAFAKAVILDVDGRTWMAVVPATMRVDLRQVQACLGSKRARLASEAEFASLFPDCDLGAMPIFGSLYGIPVVVSQSLTEVPEIAFTAGTHREIVRIRTGEWLAAERPKVCEPEPVATGTT